MLCHLDIIMTDALAAEEHERVRNIKGRQRCNERIYSQVF